MSDIITVGWREWFSFPELGLEHIKGKIDTGARTSALHAFEVQRYQQDGLEMVRFLMHPKQKNTSLVKECTAEILEERWVTDSGGHRERRYVIQTMVKLGEFEWPIELTLTNRDTMKFRMLLGRTAMTNIIVNPSESYLIGKPFKPKSKKTKREII